MKKLYSQETKWRCEGNGLVPHEIHFTRIYKEEEKLREHPEKKGEVLVNSLDKEELFSYVKDLELHSVEDEPLLTKIKYTLCTLYATPARAAPVFKKPLFKKKAPVIEFYLVSEWKNEWEETIIEYLSTSVKVIEDVRLNPIVIHN